MVSVCSFKRKVREGQLHIYLAVTYDKSGRPQLSEWKEVFLLGSSNFGYWKVGARKLGSGGEAWLVKLDS